jgi:hypothetical protein
MLHYLAGFGVIEGEWKKSLNGSDFDSLTAVKTGQCLDTLEKHFRYMRKTALTSKDITENKIGRDKLMQLREQFENRKLNEYMLNEMEIERLIETPRRMIQKYAPVYMRPLSNYGRSHFYAPYKKIGNIAIDTFWFNIIVLWLVTLCLYIALYYNLLQKALNITGNIRIPWKDSKMKSV